MEKTKKAADSKEDEPCTRKIGTGMCKNCKKHYKDLDRLEMKRKKLPPDEQRCCRTDGKGRRCKNFRMSHGRFCEKHSNKKLHKNVTEEDDDETGGIQSDTSDIQGGSANVGTKRKKNREMEKKKLPPDEQRCGLSDGKGWRCKNFRMGHGAVDDDDTVPKTRYCEKHYISRGKYYENLNKRRRKRFRDGEGAGTDPIGETRGSEWRRRKVTEEDDETKIQKLRATIDDISVTIAEGGTGNIRRKRKNVERAEGSGEIKSLTETKDPEDDVFVDDTLGEYEDSDSYVDSENYLGDLMDMLGMNNWNMNAHQERKWTSEADMLSSFEEDPDSDTSRCITLAKFLMDEDCKSDSKKSVEELETLDSKAVYDCKKLAKRYSIYLFDIYENGKDPFFLPATTASHGDQTTK